MPVRPIDIQISIQRSSDYTKEANLQNQKANINQLVNTREFQYQIEHAQRKVVSTGQTYYKKVNKEAEKAQSFHDNTGRQDRKRRRKDETAAAEMKEKIKGVNIDIKV